MKQEIFKLLICKHIKYVLKISLVASLILFFAISRVEANPIDPTDLEVFFDRFLETQMEEHHIPNATVSVVANGEVILQKGYGYANLDGNIPVDPKTTLFRIGSTSKLFTWTAVMQLVEQGKLDLDTDVNTYLDFAIPARLEKHFSKAEATPITMRHLMTHTPGFEDALDGLFYLSADQAPPLDEYLRTYLPARVFPAGEVMAYSNYGTALAGYIVERVSGTPFAEHIEQNIYAPLGMDNSTFRQPLPKNLSPNLARPYRFVQGEYLEGGFEYMPMPAGSMSTTASDMAKFMIAHLQGGHFNGNQILKEDTIKKMHSQQFTHDPRLGGMTLGFMEGTFNNRMTLSHGGGTMLFNTGLYLLPEENVGIFISFSGGSGSNHLVHTELYQAFLDRYYPFPRAQEQVQLVEGTKGAEHLLGQYHANRRSFTTPSSILSLMTGVVQIDADEDGYLLATYLGETNRLLEIESGVYHNLREERTQDYYGPFRTLIFDTDSFGSTMLMSDGPMTYSKAPWYATSQFTVATFVAALLIILGTLITWVIGLVLRILRGRKYHDAKLALAARWTAIAFGITTLGLILGFVISNEIDPVYGVPLTVFGVVPAWAHLIDLLPRLMAFWAVPILIFAILAWHKRFWGAFSRIHYSLFSAATMVLIWLFYYWNLL